MFEISNMGSGVGESPTAPGGSPATASPASAASTQSSPDSVASKKRAFPAWMSPEVVSKLQDLGLGISEAKPKAAAKAAIKDCKICGQPSEKKSLYFKTHKRAYESIYRRVQKFKEQDEEHEEVLAFNKIFGGEGEEGDEAIQSKVLLDFVRLFLEGKSTRGKSRGKLDLVNYVRSEGVRDEVGAVSRCPLLDWELFQKKMETKRGWNPAKASLLPADCSLSCVWAFVS